MSQYYNPQRSRNIYDPRSEELFRLSRGKIDNFINCPRCFYMDRRLGVAQPPGYPFSLNSAVDTLLKKEFDVHRARGTRHPLMETYGIDAVPLSHEKMDDWRESKHKGITYQIPDTNVVITGGVDDVWVTQSGASFDKAQDKIFVVDYKATSKNDEVTLDADWQIGYKRQMEIYQWLFRKNGFKVSDTGYFVYCNGNTDREAFDGKLEFEIKIIPHIGNTDWVEPTILDAIKCLRSDVLPPPGEECDFCAYRKAVKVVEEKIL